MPNDDDRKNDDGLTPEEEWDRTSAQKKWEGIYGQQAYDETIVSVSASQKLHDDLRRAIEGFGLRRGSIILIHGCGTDINIPNLVAEFDSVRKVVCVDFPGVVEHVDTSRLRFPQKIEYVGMDATHLSERYKNVFDAVISINSLVDKTRAGNQALIDEIFKSTKPDGFMYATLPDADFTDAQLNKETLAPLRKAMSFELDP